METNPSHFTAIASFAASAGFTRRAAKQILAQQLEFTTPDRTLHAAGEIFIGADFSPDLEIDMNLKTVIIGALFALGLGAAEANADVTYIYTGKPFTALGESPNSEFYTLPTSLSSKITLPDVIPPNLTGSTFRANSYSFFDTRYGTEYLFNQWYINQPVITLSTNASGDIVSWFYTFDFSDLHIESSSYTGDLFSEFRFSAYNETPGSWSLATAAVPEPATWAMMITGFFGAGAMIRRRRPGLQAAIA